MNTKYIKNSERGMIPAFLLVVIMAASIVSVAGGIYITQRNVKRDEVKGINSILKEDKFYLDKDKIQNSKIEDRAVGVALLPDGSYSSFKVIDAQLIAANDSRYDGETKLEFMSGDVAFGVFDENIISPFYLSDGTKVDAAIIDRVVVPFVLSNGDEIALKLIQGKVENGRLVGKFLGQTYTSGYLIAGDVDSTGNISSITLASGARRMSEAQTVISVKALSLFKKLSYSTSSRVLGESTDTLDYTVIQGLPQPFYDNKKNVWSFGTTDGSASTSSIANVVSYLQNSIDSIVLKQVEKIVVKDTETGEITISGIAEGIEDILSGSSALTITGTGETRTLSLDLSEYLTEISDSSVTSSSIKDGEVKEEDLSDSSVTSSKITDGTITNSDINTSAAISDSKLSQITSSNKVAGSAIELSATGGLENNSGLSLLTSCSDGELLKWNSASTLWECASDGGGGGGGSVDIQENDSTITSGASYIDFLGTDFALTNSPSGEANVSIDYTNSKIVRSDQTQSISGAWTFGSGVTIGSDTITDPTGTGIALSGGALTTTLGTSIDISGESNLSASDGITLTGDALTNSDKGSSQNIFKTIAVSGQSDVVTDTNGDTLTLVAGSNVTLTTNAITDTVTIAATDTNTTYSAGNDLDLTGTTFDIESTLDSVSTINLVGTGTINGIDAIDNTSESTIESAVDTLGNLTSASSLVTVGTLTSGSTGTGFTLDFGNSTLSGNITGSNISGVDISSDTNLTATDGVTLTGDQLTATLGTSITNSELDNDTIDLDKVNSSLTLDEQTTISAGSALNLRVGNNVTFTTTGTGSIIGTDLSCTDCIGSTEISGLTWSEISSTPTDLSGYGITDALGTSTSFGGDVSGSYSAISLGGNTVDDSELVDSLTYTGALSLSNLTLSDTSVPLTGNALTFDFNNASDRTLTISNSGAGTSNLSVDGTISASNLSGTNTGDQTITLTGDVTGSGTGSFATTIQANSVALTTDTTGNYVAGVSSGNNAISVSGSGSEGSTPSVSLALQSSSDALSSTTSSGSGLEVTSGGATLLQGCNDGQLLKWNESGDTWGCSSDSTGGSGSFTIKEGGSSVLAAATAINYSADDFDITDEGDNQAGVGIDYTNSKIVRSDEDETITGNWTITSTDLSCTNCIGSTEISGLTWAEISGTPTTLSGYGITDALSNNTSSTQDGYFGDLYLRDDTSPSHYLQITDAENLTSNRVLSLSLGNSNRTLTLSGDSTISGTNTGDQTITLEGDVTGTGTGTFSTTIAADSVALTTDTTGNYVQSITNGSGISGGNGGGEGSALTLALGALTSDWTQSGAFDILLSNASSELKIKESSGDTYYGILEVGDLGAADATYTFSGTSGTVLTSANIAAALSGWDQDSSNDLTTSTSFGGDVSGNYNSISLADNTVDDAELTNSLTYTGALSLSNLTLSDTNIPLTGSALTLDFNNGSDRTLTITNSNGGAVANLTVEGAISGSNFSGTSSGTNTGDQTISLTGDVVGSGTGSFSTAIQANSVALTTDTTGNYVASVTNGNGISGADGGSEGAGLTLALGALTGTWDQTGAFDIQLNNSSSELKILESGSSPSLYGIFDVGDLSSSDATYTFSGASGTVLTSANAVSALSGWDQDSSNDLTTSTSFTGDVSGEYNTLVLGSNTVDDSELVDSLTYTGALSVGNLTISDTNVPLTGSSFTFDFNTANNRTLTITNSNGSNVANLSVEGDVAGASVTTGGDTIDEFVGTGLTLSSGDLQTTLGTSIANSELDNDTVDFDKMADSLTLDVQTDIVAGSALSLRVGNNATLTTTGTGSIIGTDLSCTDCIGATEITDLALGTDTSGNYVATVTGGAGLTGSGSTEGSAPTLAVGAGTGITVNADDIAVNQSTNFAWTGTQTHTNTITDAGAQSTYALTLGDDGNADVISGVQIDVTSVATGDTDTVYGLNISNITAQANVVETAINIGTGWEQAINAGGTLLSLTELQLLNDGIANSELTDSGTLTVTTVDINGGAIDGTAIGANSASTGAFTTLSSTGITTIGNSSSTVAINSSDWDIDATGAITGVSFDANGTGNSISNLENADLANDTITLTTVADSLTLDGANLTFASSDSTNDYKIVFDNSSTGDIATLLQVATSGSGSTIGLALDLSDNDIATAIAIGSNDVTVGGATLSSSEVALLDSGIALSELTDSGTLTVTTVDINGGNIDGTAIGAASRSTALFTTLGTNGNVTLGDANSDTVTINAGTSGTGIAFGDSSFANCTALETVSGVLTCGSDGGGGGTLDEAYNGGGSVTVDAYDVLFDLNDSSNDYGVVIDNNTAGAIAIGLEFTSGGGGALTTAIDASANEIGTAIAIGSNDVTVGGSTITSSEFALIDSGIALSELTDSGTLTAGTVDINGGNIDGTVLGATSAAAGTFTQFTVTTGALALNSESLTFDGATLTINGGGAVDIQDGLTADTLSVDSGNLSVSAGSIDGAQSLSSTTSDNSLQITLTNGTSSGTQNVAYLDNAASSGTTESILVIDNSDSDTVVSNAIEFVIAGGSGFTNLFNVNGTAITSSEFTIIDGGIALSELTDSGTLTATTVDINGGAIDGVTIGGSSAGAGTFSSLTSNGDLIVTGGDVTGANSETIDIGETDNGSIILSAAGETNNESLELDFEAAANTVTLATSTGVTNIDLSAIYLVNVGNSGTDFDSSGGLTLASTLTLTNNTITCTSCIDVTDIGSNAVDDSELVDSLTYTGTLNISSNALAVNSDSITADGATLTINAGGTVNIQDNLTVDTDLTVSGGDFIGSNADRIDIGESDNGSITFAAAGESNNEDFEFDLETASNTLSLFSSTGVVTIDLGSSMFLTNIGNSGTDFTSTGGLTLDDILTINDDLTVALASASENVEITDASTPTSDVLSIVADGAPTANDVNAVEIDFTTGDGSSVTNSALQLDVVSGGTASGDIVYGINLTMDAADNSTQTAINVDSDWDTILGGTTAGVSIFDFTNFDVTSAGALDVSSTITAGSGNEVITLSTGKVDADALTLTSSGSAGAINSSSGLEVVSDGLTLLKGCSDGDVMQWDEGNSYWECDADNTSAGGGIATIEEDNSVIDTTVTNLDFLGADFDLTESPEDEINVTIASAIAREGDNETVTGDWAFSFAGSEALDITNSTLNSSSDTLSVSQTLTGDVNADGISITITNNNAANSTATNIGLNIVNADNSTNTSVIDSLALFSNDQATETLADGLVVRHNASSGGITDAIQIENTTAGGTITNAIAIRETAGTITDGILVSGTLSNILNSDSIDITGAGAITGATGITSSGEITLSSLTNCNALSTDGSGVVSCSQGPNTASFSDTNPGAFANNTTTEIFNDATRPNITPTSTSSTILVMVHVKGRGASTTDSMAAMRIVEEDDDTSTPECDGTDPQVGDVLQTSFTTNNAATDLTEASGSFLHSPSTTSNQQYTICSQSMAGTHTSQRVDVVLVELGADLAENYFASDETVEAGDIVISDQGLAGYVVKSNIPYDQRTLGVVSTLPSLTMFDTKGASNFGKTVPIALSGRIPVKVTTLNGEIKAGDYLTTSSVPGVAMKSTGPGVVIGQALNDYNGSPDSIGSVIVFVKNTYFAGNNSLETAEIELSTVESLEVSNGLKVLGTSEFNGLTFFGGVVEFTATPIFNNDMAGFAKIKKGDREVKVEFEKEYLGKPVVNVTPNWEVDQSTLDVMKELGTFILPKQDFIIANATTKGFTIILETPAVVDLDFSWMAIAVKDAKLFTSLNESSTPASTTEPITNPSPEPSPSLETLENQNEDIEPDEEEIVSTSTEAPIQQP